MSRRPTNSLILTNLPEGCLENPRDLAEFLSKDQNKLEMVALQKFQRIMIICPDSRIATAVRDELQNSDKWMACKICYSMKDNEYVDFESQGYFNDNASNNYLELPSESGSRRFLISPPLSPEPEWDHWDREEEGPNKKSVYSPQELSHLLWERLGGFDSSNVRKYDGLTRPQDEQEQPPSRDIRDMEQEPTVLFEDIDNDIPAIMLDTVNNRNTVIQNKKPMPRTQMPPS
ncbi:Piso0_001741 [Millerozyma farinosa CBS 7064]|uniref:Piso0_001741 protein n=1 Tax=Pichia sorbitophila (strain ATCC MYA-4447 / BCRC 22081 / CBS 7064 / NBRC 10061 / NRRL Y-12695) TaxID=559304 RepID=G8YNZ1_PICSO|nr:Piso0_001741 [Millerozyma farinosa CBS 7064]